MLSDATPLTKKIRGRDSSNIELTIGERTPSLSDIAPPPQLPTSAPRSYAPARFPLCCPLIPTLCWR